jgi:lysophospholipase L1-like esterase
MPKSRRPWKWIVPCASALVLLAAPASSGIASAASAAPSGLPSRVAALGDSITTAWGSGGSTSDNLPASWATGTDASVDSHLLRLRALGATIPDANVQNLAKPGIKVTNTSTGITVTAGQIDTNTDYVMIEVGSADLCASDVTTPADLTPAATFGARIADALHTLNTRTPNAKIFIASIPNWYQEWQVVNTKPHPDYACPLLYAAGADTTTRNAVRDTTDAYNTQLQNACAAAHNCRYDNGAAHAITFTTSDVSTTDWFHPSTSGQAKLAAATWPTSWYTTGNPPPPPPPPPPVAPSGGGAAPPAPNLHVAVTPSSTAPTIGSAYTLDIAVGNSGGSASGVTVAVTLPGTLTFVSGAGCTGTAPITCTLGSLAAGSVVHLGLATTVVAAGSLATLVTASSAAADADPSDNAVTTTGTSVAAGVEAARTPSLAVAAPILRGHGKTARLSVVLQTTNAYRVRLTLVDLSAGRRTVLLLKRSRAGSAVTGYAHRVLVAAGAPSLPVSLVVSAAALKRAHRYALRVFVEGAGGGALTRELPVRR